MNKMNTPSPAQGFFSIVFGVIPILWLGGLAYYFYSVNDAAGGMFSKELGPTIIGLGFVTLLFSLPLLFKLMRIVGRASQPVEILWETEKDSDPGSNGFDADAAIARHLARKAATSDQHDQTQRHSPAEIMHRPSFGRKNS